MLCIYIIFRFLVNQFFGIMRVVGGGLMWSGVDYKNMTTIAVEKEAIIWIFQKIEKKKPYKNICIFYLQ